MSSRAPTAVLAFGLALLLAGAAAQAACDSDQAMTKASAISDMLSDKVQTKPDEASKLMSEMGTIMGTGSVTADTCAKLDGLAVRAKAL